MAETGKAGGKRPGGWSVLWGLARNYRSRMVLLAIASFLGAMLEAGFLVLLTSTVLALAAGRDTVGPLLGQAPTVTVTLWLAAAAVAARLALGLSTVWISSTLGARIRSEQRRLVAFAYLRADWGVQQGEASGRLQEILSSFVARINAAMTSLTQAITASLSLLAFMSAGVIVDPLATVAVLGALALLGLGLTPVRRLIRKQATRAIKTDLVFATTVAEFGALGQEMRTFGVRDRFEARLDEVFDATTEQQRRVQVLGGLLTPVYTFLAYVSVISGVALLQFLGVGDLAAFGSLMLLMLRSLSYGQQLVAVSGAIASSIPSLEAVDETVAHYIANQSDDGALQPARVTPLRFDDVSFAYSTGRAVLADVTLSLHTGEMIGVIGPSGAGKSTMAQLILGLRRPSSGVICVDGADLRQVNRRWWTNRVAFVPQDPVLFTGTVADNIRFFRDGLTEDALSRAAEQANILNDIESLPLGFDTHLGERGSQLSGGQRQRMSIARALVGQPELLVLDEPTSALDGRSEALVRETLGALRGHVTVVLIAHRMSTLDLCDRIVVIEGGRVSALGTPEELLRSSAFYRNALAAAGMA